MQTYMNAIFAMVYTPHNPLVHKSCMVRSMLFGNWIMGPTHNFLFQMKIEEKWNLPVEPKSLNEDDVGDAILPPLTSRELTTAEW